MAATTIGSLTFSEPLTEEHKTILTTEACDFVAGLVAEFADRRSTLLQARDTQVANYAATKSKPAFLPETANVRNDDWKIADLPKDLQKRTIEITGPVDRKMVINALNSDADMFMADFEDSLSPTWGNIIDGQVNLRDACHRTIAFTNEAGKTYQLQDNPATLLCRVRGLHLDEKHVLSADGKAIPGCLLDFGLYLWHNHRALAEHNTGPYFYIPKLESYLEARWWNEVIVAGQQKLGLPVSTVRVTCLIETLPAVFQMDEILYELKDHIAALNCGRWDYIFSHIKTLSYLEDRIMPDRDVVTMSSPFMRAYSNLLIYTCHRRGALAMGGMSAFIPSRDQAQNQAIIDKVYNDKLDEASRGHDGAWVAHPGLADIARKAFNECLDGKDNQLDKIDSAMADISAEQLAEQLLDMPNIPPTEAGVRTNIRIALQYLAAWIDGSGCVPIYGMMEDAATAEISRSSLWQLVQHQSKLANNQQLTTEVFDEWLDQETETCRSELAESSALAKLDRARDLLRDMCVDANFENFLTLPAYKLL